MISRVPFAPFRVILRCSLCLEGPVLLHPGSIIYAVTPIHACCPIPRQLILLQNPPKIFVDKDKGTNSEALWRSHGEGLQILPTELWRNTVQGRVHLPTYIYFPFHQLQSSWYVPPLGLFFWDDYNSFFKKHPTCKYFLLMFFSLQCAWILKSALIWN